MARPGAIKLLSFTCCNEQQTSRNLSASKRTAEPNNSKHQKVKTSRVLEQKVDKCGLTYMIIHGLTKISQVVFFGLYDFTTLRRAAELQYSSQLCPGKQGSSGEASFCEALARCRLGSQNECHFESMAKLRLPLDQFWKAVANEALHNLSSREE